MKNCPIWRYSDSRRNGKLPHFHIPSMLMMAHLSMKKLPTELSFHWRKEQRPPYPMLFSISLLAWGAGHWNLTGRCSLHHLQWEQGITTYGVLNSVKVSSFTVGCPGLFSFSYDNQCLPLPMTPTSLCVQKNSRIRIPCPPGLQNNTSLEYALNFIVPAGKRTDVDKKPKSWSLLQLISICLGLESSRDIPKLHLSESQGRMAGLGFDHLCWRNKRRFLFYLK
ncbi:hypothetical protein AAG906_019708 [Vitis piasezkii]